MGTRAFSAQLEDSQMPRNVDADAPNGFRLELVDAVFQLGIALNVVSEAQLYRVLIQSMGIAGAPGNPMPGYRQGAVRQIQTLDWRRVFDLICRWWTEFPANVRGAYLEAVNPVLSGNRIAWNLQANGTMRRVVPEPVQIQVDATFQELRDPRFAAARLLFQAALDAYNDRPRRGRDVCANVFDAMESVAKTKYNRPNDTFGQVKTHLEQNNLMRVEILGVFTSLNGLRNHNFGHGMVEQFDLSAAEIDFVWLSCISAILLFVRTP